MKRRTLPACMLVLFVLTVCLPIGGRCEGGTAIQVVETDGAAPVTGNDLARARSEAVRDALRRAVEQVSGRWLMPEDEATKPPSLKQQIIDRAERFIQEYRIVSEMTVEGVHTVAVRASVLADSLREELHRLGLAKQVARTTPATHISLTIRGIRTSGDYVRCRAILKDGIPGIREIIPREAAWSLARFDVAAEGGVPALIERIREKLAVEVQRQEDRALEVRLK
ncbi:MAG: flagellar assembly protein T N-terminal domain-containing protein [Syntrophales bacterium]